MVGLEVSFVLLGGLGVFVRKYFLDFIWSSWGVLLVVISEEGIWVDRFVFWIEEE